MIPVDENHPLAEMLSRLLSRVAYQTTKVSRDRVIHQACLAAARWHQAEIRRIGKAQIYARLKYEQETNDRTTWLPALVECV